MRSTQGRREGVFDATLLGRHHTKATNAHRQERVGYKGLVFCNSLGWLVAVSGRVENRLPPPLNRSSRELGKLRRKACARALRTHGVARAKGRRQVS